MKKTQLTLAISLAITPLFAIAEQTNQADIEVLTVTGNRSLTQSFNVLAGIDTFERQDIELIQPVNITDLLSRVAGVSVATNGGHGQTASVFMRGANSDHVLVLIDGIRVGSATTGNKALSDLPIDSIERIEVVRGPRAAIWGADALAGVIQIFTREHQTGSGGLQLSVGSNDYRGANLTAGLGNQQHNLTTSISTEAETGYDVATADYTSPDKDGFEKNALLLKGHNELSPSLTLNSLLSIDKGSVDYDDGVTYNQNNLIALTANWNTQLANTELRIANSKDDSTSVSSYGTSRYITNRQQANILSQFNLSDNFEIATGVDYFQDEVSGTVDYSENKRNTVGAFVSARSVFDDLKAELSLRRDNVESVSTENTYTWSLGYHFMPNLLIAFTQGTGFKAPSFNNLYSPLGPYSIGNPNLEFETSFNRELLAKYQTKQVNVALNIFKTEFDNLIEYVYGGYDGTIATYKNVQQAETKGVEISVNYNWASYSLKQVLSYTSAKDVLADTDLIRRPRLTSFTGLTYSEGAIDYAIEADVRGNSSDYSGGYVPTRTLFNASLAYKINPNLSLSARLDNLFDKEYFTVNGYRAIGRFAKLSLNYQF